MPATYFTINLMLEEQFGGVALAAVDPLWFGISTATFTKSTGAPTGEPTGLGGYGRVEVDNDQVTWDTATAGVLTNLIAVDFPECTEATGWGTMTTVFIADAETVGNTLWYATLTPEFAVPSGMIVSFPIGTITITFT